jgi:ABC-type antimicrobial peptide transport system permease subunit
VTRTILQLDPNLPILSVRTVNEQLDRRLMMERLVAELATFFGLVALFMATLGLYGVLSYSMTRRANEIGIRMALGASRMNVTAMVLREALSMVAIGAVIGLPSALALGTLIRTQLYGLTTFDPAAMTTAIAVTLSAAILAGYLPARRASRIDPMVSLRCD